jgi:hypothetical protein
VIGPADQEKGRAPACGKAACVPQSTTMVCPVTKLESSETRNNSGPAISSGWPQRPSGVPSARAGDQDERHRIRAPRCEGLRKGTAFVSCRVPPSRTLQVALGEGFRGVRPRPLREYLQGRSNGWGSRTKLSTSSQVRSGSASHGMWPVGRNSRRAPGIASARARATAGSRIVLRPRRSVSARSTSPPAPQRRLRDGAGSAVE